MAEPILSAEILDNLKKSVLGYDTEEAASWARKAVDEKIDPIKAADALVSAIRQIGEEFSRGELWLPDLVGAADAMQNAMPIIEEEIKRTGAKRRTRGAVVIGTVYGDIHSIGKSMVCTLLASEGFDVIDLGVDVTAEEFIKAVKKHRPVILALSSLMTTTAAEQKKVINTLTREGFRDKVKIMVGGGAITKEFAENIGADGYDPTAPGAAKLAVRLLEK